MFRHGPILTTAGECECRRSKGLVETRTGGGQTRSTERPGYDSNDSLPNE